MMARLKAATLQFTKLAIVWLMALFVIRTYELVVNALSRDLPKEWAGIVFWSLGADVVFWLKWLVFLYIVFVVLYFAYSRLAKLLFSLFIVILVISHVLLVQYFNTSLVPLGSDLYGYSIADIKQTVGASGGVNIFMIVGILILLALVMAALKYVPRWIKLPIWIAAVLLTISLGTNIFATFPEAIRPSYSSDFANNLALNKADYFFTASYFHFFAEEEEVDIYADAYIGDYLTTSEKLKEFAYLDEDQYPFYHKEETPDVLGPFFNPGQQKPNIVILLVEGLGRAFTNEGAYLGNFTPFIDSLSKKSLYWKNFLSQGGRTFAVLPSLVGSLPFGKNGFLEMGKSMPKHLSLYSILRNSGYKTSFYYGGDASFDNMSLFLQGNAVDKINDIKSFPSGYTKMPGVNGFTWGYGDKELFRHYFTGNTGSVDVPRLDVILTVSTHSPFLINEQGKYNSRFEQRMEELSFEAPRRDSYRNYKLQYSTILYTDDALRSFFNNYKQRSDYKNTIFIITGDHRMPEIPMSTKIDRYHVPLIIYSPLLKRSAAFNSVSTHFDITPSLISFLKQNYTVQAPGQSGWMGNGLDTARNFRNVHAYPLIQTKTETIDFIMGEYHLNGNTLYKLNPDLSEQPVKDDAMLAQLKGAFNNFKQRNAKISNGKGIVPDSVYQRYVRSK